MKRISALLALLVVLTGCGKVDQENMIAISDIQMAANSTQKPTNTTKEYFSYFLPKGVNRLESKDTYVVLQSRQNKYLLTLDFGQLLNQIKKVENQTITKTSENLSKQVKSLQNVRIDYPFETNGKQAEAIVVDLDDQNVLMILQINEVTISTISNINNSKESFRVMMNIANSVKYNTDNIKNDYDNLIEQVEDDSNKFVPPTGNIKDYIDPKTGEFKFPEQDGSTD